MYDLVRKVHTLCVHTIAAAAGLLLLCQPTQAQSAEPALPSGATCLNATVNFARYGQLNEIYPIRLTHCDGSPNLDAVEALSVLARPRRVPRPDGHRHPEEGFVATDIIRQDTGLLTRLQAIATRWPGETIVVVSGYRPRARSGSRHRHGRALDIQVTHVPLQEVVRFARSLPETGVGYYPNSLFTHIDVRDRSAFWVDLSRPGESARYVAANERESYLASPTPTDSTVASATGTATDSPEGSERSSVLANTLARLDELQSMIRSRAESGPSVAAVGTTAEPLPADEPSVTASEPEATLDDAAFNRMLARAADFAQGRVTSP